MRPHVTLGVDLADLAADPGRATGDLAGFGTIGPTQLQQMLCEGDLTPVLTAGRHAVLDVGRTARLATPLQRRAVVHRQHGTCAGPGCHAPVVHVHHVVYWSEGGSTDLDNLVGLCPRCHAHVHLGTLRIDPTTHAITPGLRPAGRRLRRRRPREPRAG